MSEGCLLHSDLCFCSAFNARLLYFSLDRLCNNTSMWNDAGHYIWHLHIFRLKGWFQTYFTSLSCFINQPSSYVHDGFQILWLRRMSDVSPFYILIHVPLKRSQQKVQDNLCTVEFIISGVNAIYSTFSFLPVWFPPMLHPFGK